MTPDYHTPTYLLPPMRDQYAAFLHAVAAAPDDDTPRLVLADWLEEHDAPERAEFIRVQCEVARLGRPRTYYSHVPTHYCKECRALWVRWPDGARPGDGGWSVASDCAPCCDNAPMGEQIAAFSASERALFAREAALLIGTPDSWGANGFLSDFISEQCPNHDLDGFGWNFRRGFVDAVRGPLAALLGPRCAACMEPNEDVPHPKCRACHGTGRTPGALERMGAELLAVRACEITDLLPDECLRPWRGCHFVYRSAAPPAFEERVNAECVVRDGDLYDEVCKLADYADNQAAGFVGQSHAGSTRVWPDAARDALSRAMLAVARRRAGLEQPKRRN